MGLAEKVKKLLGYGSLSLIPAGTQGLYNSQDIGMLSNELVQDLDPVLGAQAQAPSHATMTGLMATLWYVLGDSKQTPLYRKGLKRTLVYWGLIAGTIFGYDFANTMAGSDQSIEVFTTMYKQMKTAFQDISNGTLPPACILAPYGAAVLSTLNSIKNFFVGSYRRTKALENQAPYHSNE